MLPAAAGLLALSLVLAGCSGGTGEALRHAQGPGSPRASSTTTTTTAVPTAATSLQPYFAAAAAADGRLRAAASAINAGITPTTLTLTTAAKAAIQAADPKTVGTLIPAGADPQLTGELLLVLSDLVSRYLAMARYPVAFGVNDAVTNPTGSLTVSATIPSTTGPAGPAWAFGCLANGTSGAASFDTDLSAAERIAATLPPITPGPANSATAAAVKVWVADIWISNSGCASCGGYRYTAVPRVIWTGPAPPQGTGPTWQGTLEYSTGGSKFFHATWLATGSWKAAILVC